MEHSKETLPPGGESKTALIRRILLKNAVIFNQSQLEQLEAFVCLLIDWNKKINLVSRRDIENIWEAHILHSMSILFQGDIPTGATVLDLGSGGGLPGIPLKILRPDVSVHLLDATRKKMDAATSMVEALKLSGIRVMWGRAEDTSTIVSLEGKVDVVVARAVAPLSNLVTWSLPYLRRAPHKREPGPRLIALKGGDIENEVSRARSVSAVKDVIVKELTFYGSELIPGPDKKIVSVRFYS